MSNADQQPTPFDPGTGQPVSPNSPGQLQDPHYVHPSHPESEELQPYRPLNKLNDRHRRVAYLEMCGCSNNDIARDVGYHPVWVSQLRQNPTYRLHLAELRRKVTEHQVEDINDRLMKMSEDALHTIHGIMMNSENEKTRLRAAEDLFDRQAPKVNKVQTDNRHSFYIDSESIHTAISAMAECVGADPNRMLDQPTENALVDLEKLMDDKYTSQEAPQKGTNTENQ